jgi:hypothetical protein
LGLWSIDTWLINPWLIDANHPRRVANDDGPRRYVLGHNAQRPDPRVVTDQNRSDDDASRAEVDIVSDSGHSFFAAVTPNDVADRRALPELAVGTHPHPGVQHDGVRVEES